MLMMMMLCHPPHLHSFDPLWRICSHGCQKEAFGFFDFFQMGLADRLERDTTTSTTTSIQRSVDVLQYPPITDPSSSRTMECLTTTVIPDCNIMNAAESVGGTIKNNKTVSCRKRRFKEWKDGHGSRPPVVLNNPKRGTPGILLTCDRGREKKCQREALQIIDHYYEKQHEGESCSNDDVKKDNNEAKSMSLEEELTQLQEEEFRKKGSNFGIFETGCSGVVFLLCTVPGSEMIPPVKLEKKARQQKLDGQEQELTSEEGDEHAAKKQKMDSEKGPATKTGTDDSSVETPSGAEYSTKWDPVPIVRKVLQDIENDTGKDAPSSRFVSRMIPLQATCYVSEEELQIASRLLIQRYFPVATTTFAVAVKRRFCQAALPKAKIIDIMAAAVLEKVPKCKVDLDKPEVTVVMEICKTMCGLSVIPNCQDHFKNFNLAEARGKRSETDHEE
jgi:tRNA acetyltransferase TAN1